MKERQPYPSDISREQFGAIRPQMECFRRVTKPRQYELYDIFCGIGGTGSRWSRKKTTLLIVDAQSVKNADTAGTKGYDAGKKVSGIKRHIAVDTLGLPHAIAITPADVTDRKGGLLALSCRTEYLTEVRKVLVDGGYAHIKTKRHGGKETSEVA